MSLPGERLIIAATLDGVEQGETFKQLPPNMVVAHPFNVPENRRFRVINTMDRLFTDRPAFKDAIGGRKLILGAEANISARQINKLETVKVKGNAVVNPEWFALDALIRSLGSYEDEDRDANEFSPRIFDTSDFALGYRRRAVFQSVSLISTEGEDQSYHVLANFPLGRE